MALQVRTTAVAYNRRRVRAKKPVMSPNRPGPKKLLLKERKKYNKLLVLISPCLIHVSMFDNNNDEYHQKIIITMYN